jgi:DNA-binding GntR family transcriptional regulator
MDDVEIDKLITAWADEGMPMFARIAGNLLHRMRDGEIRKGGQLPTNAVVSRKLAASASVISYAKQLLFVLGFAAKGSDGYTSLVEPRSGGRRPDAAKILAWQHGELTERIMADLADQIVTGRLARGAELPDPETLQAQWECETVRPPTQALQRLVAYPGLVTLDGGRYFVT